MAIKKKSGGGGGGANWMATYGDMVTLLLCFFVLLYSMSTISEEKFKAIAQSFNPMAIPTVTDPSGMGGPYSDPDIGDMNPGLNDTPTAQEQIDAMKQTISMLVIDKKRMKLKDAGLPQIILDQTPKLLRGSKLPVVKAKVGPQIMTLICEEKIFDAVPVKKEVKAVVSGIYITDVKGLHGKAPAVEQKKKSRFKELVEKAQEKAGAKPVK